MDSTKEINNDSCGNRGVDHATPNPATPQNTNAIGSFNNQSTASYDLDSIDNSHPKVLFGEILSLLGPEDQAKYKHLLRSHELLPKPKVVSAHRPKSLLTLIPEIREHILKYLLVNPELGYASSICGWNDVEFVRDYGLCPAILRVCKQFYAEGMAVLYGQNKFLIECSPAICRSLRLSPLTRYYNNVNLTRHWEPNDQPKLQNVPALKYVQHWKVVVSMVRWFYDEHGTMVTPLLGGALDFCRAICLCKPMPKSLEILIIPRGLEFRNGRDPIYCEEELVVRKKLSPFELLRNIGRVTIRNAEFSEIPDDISSRSLELERAEPYALEACVEQRLVELLQGDSEVEFAHKMLTTLMDYAQSFERVVDFNKAIAYRLVTVAGTYVKVPIPSDAWPNPFRISCDAVDFYRSAYWHHPVESGLFKAIEWIETCGDINDSTPFKTHRSAVVNYLERQYEHIQRSADNLTEFVKAQKRPGRIFDPLPRPFDFYGFYDNSENSVDLYYTAIFLLENYAESLARELTFETRFQIRCQNNLYRERFEALPRETSIRECAKALKSEDWTGFVKHFKAAVDDMDCQFREILRTRKEIYKWDLGESGHDIAIHYSKSHEPINWDVQEPAIGWDGFWGEYRHFEGDWVV